ncbi:hypothetical protein BO71DRAFT_433368 [Aspergillus ellipticus CBS 707.79]|uniref:Uncharacterized protein n=1 Tax=Aspergillus ellipticus CBS 707.79 TaxID=1448320 RepID=A0A319D1M2_9EURO|nr:hypothetical protein BO71DRAFT_433368 [Aspergillus ellipticus CBS 707.79]
MSENMPGAFPSTDSDKPTGDEQSPSTPAPNASFMFPTDEPRKKFTFRMEMPGAFPENYSESGSKCSDEEEHAPIPESDISSLCLTDDSDPSVDNGDLTNLSPTTEELSTRCRYQSPWSSSRVPPSQLDSSIEDIGESMATLQLSHPALSHPLVFDAPSPSQAPDAVPESSSHSEFNEVDYSSSWFDSSEDEDEDADEDEDDTILQKSDSNPAPLLAESDGDDKPREEEYVYTPLVLTAEPVSKR